MLTMANTTTIPVLTQRSPAVVGGPNASLAQQVHDGGSTPPPTTTPAPTPGAPGSNPRIITKFQFRMLFTTAERMNVDNINYSSAPNQVKAAVTTLLKDLEVSGTVDL